jgi:hypothetical protein
LNAASAEVGINIFRTFKKDTNENQVMVGVVVAEDEHVCKEQFGRRGNQIC